MSKPLFRGFGQFVRPDIGLISDGFQNLSEIFESDRRSALRNVLLAPEVLDSVYGLSSLISREDLRAVSGLSKFLLPTIHQINRISEDRIRASIEETKNFFDPEFSLGGVGAPSLNQPNVILYNGAIQCEGALYRTNTIGDSLFSSPVRQTVAFSTSRASLFNTEADESDPGFFKTVKYPGSIRVRRRSHVNRIVVPQTSFITKPPVFENPSHSIRVDVDNGNTGTSVPVKLLATKNTPLRIFCRLGVGRIKFTFTDSLAPYFFGYQIQPVQQRPFSSVVDFLPVQQVTQSTGSNTFTLDLDINGTGYQNLYDLYLYLYVNPEKVLGLEFENINIKESPDRKDLGLIGFNNLEVLRVTGGSLTILPLWLKTLSNKLRILDLAASGNVWKSGPMAWFDIRNPSATPSFSHPLYTAVSYLTIPKKGPIINEDGDDWSDPLFEKYILDQPRVAGTDYRQFTNLTELYLGDRFFGLNPRLDDVFPNLRVVRWTTTQGPVIFAGLPKLRNNGTLISYDISGSGASGSIYDIGLSTDPSDPEYISKYLISSFNISGTSSVPHDITGYIANPVEDWSSWLTNTVSINISRTQTSINLQAGRWVSLSTFSGSSSLGAQFSVSSTPLKTPVLTSLNLSNSGSTGQVPSLGSSPTENTNSLTDFNLSACNNLSAIVKNGFSYLLPENFAPLRSGDTAHKLTTLSFSSFTPPYRLRQNDLQYLYNLNTFSSESSGLTGKLPTVPLAEVPAIQAKAITVRINNSNFYDIRSLSVNPGASNFSRDIRTIQANNLNTVNGGALLPDFSGTTTASVVTVNLTDSLTSTYRTDWSQAGLTSSVVKSSHPATSLSGLSITRTIQDTGGIWTESDNVFVLTGSTVFRQNVMVNDSVRATATGPEIARVLSVSGTEVVIDRDIPGTLPSPLFFTRNTVDASPWFATGLSSLSVFSARNCRLSGVIDIRAAMFRVTSLDLSRNSILEFASGGLSRIFTGDTRRVTIDLSSNSLNISSIQGVISEVHSLDLAKRFTNCVVRVGQNKLSSDDKYTNYSQTELFPVVISLGPDKVTSLVRNELFYTYQDVTETDEFGNQTTSRVITGTRTIPIPGILVGSIYYKTLTEGTQITEENPLAVKFKALTGIRVDLGFTYVSPSTGTTVISTTYSDVTTRTQSIIDAGYDPLDLVNP